MKPRFAFMNNKYYKFLYDIRESISNIKISHARKIVNTRNKISHGYDEIENAEIWNIIINYLPLLKNEVEVLLNP